MHRLMVRLLPLLPRFLVWRVARRYVAGTTVADALTAVRALRDADADTTLALLGEHVVTARAAEQARDDYLDLLHVLATSGLATHLSVKPSLLGLGVDEGLAAEHLEAVVRQAAAQDVFVRLDMEDHRATDATLRLYQGLHARHGNVGVVLQAYLRRTLADIAALPAGANVRLCKGIYVEPRRVAWTDRETVRTAYVAALAALLDRGASVGIATHDEHLVQQALALVRARAVPRDRYELQMLLGVDPELRAILLDEGHRLRVYVPYGPEWYAYSLRRLRENPRIAGYVMSALLRRTPRPRHVAPAPPTRKGAAISR